MNINIEIKLDGFGGVCFCVEDDPYGGILGNGHRAHFLAHALDEFWLRIRNR